MSKFVDMGKQSNRQHRNFESLKSENRTRFWQRFVQLATIRAVIVLGLSCWAFPGSAQAVLQPFARQTAGLPASLTDGKTGNYKTAADLPVDPRLEPFYHVVASGDPTQDGIILWTRVTPVAEGSISVEWEVSLDTVFDALAQSGSVMTDSSVDYTVKVPVSGLLNGTTYYYRFRALDNYSIIGRTRTADQNASQLRFAVVSCNSYPAGYFNAFCRIAERNDLDAVIHLGDFIYEYGEDTAGATAGPERGMIEPDHEILSLSDYRQRYGWYRLDPDLRRAMQQHPFIFVWDDHETANNSWTGGAENHDPSTEGDWASRRDRGTQVYFEWAPITDHPARSIYRTFPFGDLAELRMIDTRLEGREEQLTDYLDPQLWDPDRTLLGPDQLEWLTSGLKTSGAQWKLLGNQVVFTPLILENFESIYPGVQNEYLDVWQGYPAERGKILDTIQQYNINNVVILTGDVHIAIALDVPEWDGDSLYYDAATGEGSHAVEFVGTSISSNNFDEIVGLFLSNLVEDLFKGENPQASYNEFDRHGYFILDLTASRAQADYYYVASKLEPNKDESFDEGWFTLSGENHLQQASGPAPPKPIQEIPAPDPTEIALGLQTQPSPGLYVWNAWPNPIADNRVTVAFSLNKTEEVSVRWAGLSQPQGALLYQATLTPGHYTLTLDLPAQGAGAGILELRILGYSVARKMVRL